MDADTVAFLRFSGDPMGSPYSIAVIAAGDPMGSPYFTAPIVKPRTR